MPKNWKAAASKALAMGVREGQRVGAEVLRGALRGALRDGIGAALEQVVDPLLERGRETKRTMQTLNRALRGARSHNPKKETKR